MIGCKHFSCAGNTSLDLIHHQQYIVLRHKFGSSFQIAILRNINSGFTLYRFNP